MYNEKTGSAEKTANKLDLTHSIKTFVLAFLPIFATQILINIDKIQELVLGYVTGKVPELLELMIVPAIIAGFIFIKQYLNDNSK